MAFKTGSKDSRNDRNLDDVKIELVFIRSLCVRSNIYLYNCLKRPIPGPFAIRKKIKTINNALNFYHNI